MERWHDKFGVAGVDVSESSLAHRLEKFFSFLILICIILGLFFADDTSIRFGLKDQIFLYIQNLFQALIFVEYISLLIVVKNRWHFFCTNWMMSLVLILLVFIDIFHLALLILPLKMIRLFMIFIFMTPSMRVVTRYYYFNNMTAIFFVSCIITVIFGLMVSFIDPSVQTPLDGIWWAVQTVTTVGYGDVVPSSSIGRLVGILLMIIAIAMFVSITSRLSAMLTREVKKQRIAGKKQHTGDVERDKRAVAHMELLIDELKALHKKVDALNSKDESSS